MTVEEMVQDARTRNSGLSKEHVEAELTSGDDVLLVDVRDVRERWQNGTIPGSKNVPRGMLEFWADPSSEYYKPFLKPDRRTILFCAGGKRSALAVDALMRLGYTNVTDLNVGFDAWRTEGGAVADVPIPDEYRR